MKKINKIDEKILKASDEDKLLRKCYRDLTGVNRQLEKTIQKIEDWMWDIYEKYELQFLKEYDELAKKYGEEYRNIDDLPKLVNNRLELKEKIREA